jgi:hypothetical protein
VIEGSQAPAVANGKRWRETNFALRKTGAILAFTFDTLAAVQCLCDPTCVSENICEGSKGWLRIGLEIARFALSEVSFPRLLLSVLRCKLCSKHLFALPMQILDVSEFQYGEDAEIGNKEPKQTHERVEAIYDNMGATGVWLRERFTSMGNYLDTIEDRLLRQLLPSRPSSTRTTSETLRRLAGASATFTTSNNVTFNKTYGGGCDDLDQDRDNVTDNCVEDQYPPSLSYPESLERKIICSETLCLNEYFQSQDDAKAFIEAVLHAIDDCAGPEDVRMDFQQSGECGETQFEVTPVQIFPDTSDCHGTELPGDSMVVMVGLDEGTPDVTCGFLPDLSESSISSSADGKTLHIQEGSASFVDTAFYFDIQENCPGDVKVEVKVKTNEYTGTENEKLVALSAMQSLGSVEQVFLYVAPQSCAGNSAGSAICRQDLATPLRFYEIQVVAVDKAGNKGDATCWVIVKPDGAGNSERSFLSSDDLQDAVTNSTTRIPLSKLDLTWNNVLAPSEMPSSAPSISIQPTAAPSEMPSPAPTAAAKNVEYVGNDGSPTSAYPLGECQGECDSNEDCEGGLICFQRDPGDPVPGCLGGEDDTSRNDFCISP